MIRAELALVLVAGAAHADPGFVTLDRGDASTRAGAELGYVSDHAARLDLHGQYLWGSEGVYGSIAAFRDSPYASALGDTEVGGLYVVRVADDLGVVLRAGGVLETNTFTDARQTTGRLARITDYALGSGGFTLRLAASPTVRDGRLFARADIGIDATLTDSGPMLLRLDLGAGIDAGPVAVMIETANVTALDKAGFFFDQSGDWLDSLALAVRGNIGRWQPYAAAQLLNLDSLKVVTAGVDVRL